MKRIIQAWESFLARNPGIAERWDSAVQASSDGPDPMTEFYERFVGEPRRWERAREYGGRAWRVIGPFYSLIVRDEGNGWYAPIGLEIDVKAIWYVMEPEPSQS